MALTDISLLFKDIIETPQQKQQRLFAEGQAAAGQFTGLPTGLRELAMGTAAGIPGTVESVRQFGATAGLPVQTQGEQLQRSMGGLNITDPTDQKEMVRLLSQVDPLRGAAAAEIFAEEERRKADRTRRMAFEDAREARAVTGEARAVTGEARAASGAERAEVEADRAESREERAISTFDNQMTAFNQNQTDRTNNIEASNNFKSSLLTRVLEKDPSHPFVELLESEAIIPIERLAQMQRDFLSEIKPNVAYQQIFDSTTKQNVIASIDRDTNAYTVVAQAPRTSATDRDIPIMSEAAETAIESMILSMDEWENLPGTDGGIYDALGGGTSGNQKEAGRNMLKNLVHSYSESQNIPIARVLNMINQQIFMQDNTINLDGLARLKAGYLVGNPASPTLTPEEQAFLKKYN